MFYKSIRFKVTIWYTIILSITLVLFSVVLYRNFQIQLNVSLDGALKNEAMRVANVIEDSWLQLLEEAQRAGVDTSSWTKTNTPAFLQAVKVWFQKQLREPALLNVGIRIFDARGTLLASTVVMQADEYQRKVVAVGPSSRYEIVNVLLRQEKVPLRAFTLPIIEKGEVIFAVQIISLLTPITESLDRLEMVLLILIPLTVLLTSIVGEVLAKLALKPVDDMIKTIRQISAENMNMRLALPKTKDEIARLGETFNDMLARLDEAFVVQRQFIADISHEFKTPLTILRGELEVALKKMRSPQEYEEVLKSNLEEIDRLSRMVDNLLALARFDSRDVRLEHNELDAAALVRKTTDDVRVLADRKGIQITCDCPDSALCSGDEYHLRRVFLNLLDNAIKYTPEGGRVDVRAKVQGKSVVFDIKDTGVGIPAGEISRIFDRFYRVDKSRSTHGFGLGLSIVKSVVEAHGGTVSAVSEPGKTIFTIILPILSV